MGDTVMTIIAIFVVAVLMLVYPLLSISERNEDVTQLAVQTTTSEFVDKITSTGLIKESDYNMFSQNLNSTGNTYEIEIEVKHLDENPGKKAATTSGDAIGENLTYSVFTSTIIDVLNSGKPYQLKKGDTVIVNVKNTNKTIAQLLRDFFYSVSGKSSYQVGASYSGMVVNNGKI